MQTRWSFNVCSQGCQYSEQYMFIAVNSSLTFSSFLYVYVIPPLNRSTLPLLTRYSVYKPFIQCAFVAYVRFV